MITTFRIAGCCAVLAALLAGDAARGDVCSDGVLCLDWLVDSSDEIHRVRLVPGDGDTPPVYEPLATLKPPSPEPTLAPGEVDRMSIPWLYADPEAMQGGEWLLFVRLAENRTPRITKGINLSQPMASYATAAFTREGKPIRGRDEILAALNARIRLGRRVPPKCDRDAVDELIKTAPSGGHVDWSSTYPYGDPAPLEKFLGGVLIRIDCDYWNQEGPHNHDTWINVAVVPVEPEDRERLLEAARLGEEYKGSPRYCHPIYNLVNFPDKKTEEFLWQTLRDSKEVYSERRSVAAYLLSYFIYRLESTDPLNKKLVGPWRLEGQRERIDVDFKEDNTFTATGYDFPYPHTREDPRLAWRGKGHWVVRNGKLSIGRTHAWGWGNKDWVKNSRDIFYYKPIKKVTPTEVVLEGGPPMKRR